MTDPIISIIVPCYNQAEYLPECLSSVLTQTLQNWECIIVNDGSEDETAIVSNQWVEKDLRFRYVEIENGGLSNARNIGIQNAVGEFILPLDADDKIAPDYIKLARAAFQESPSLKVVYCKAQKFGAIEETWDLKDFALEKMVYNNMIFCSALFKKTDWQFVGGYDVNMKYGWEDWEFWIALLKKGGTVKKLDYSGFFYRINENSMLQRMSKSQEKELFDYMSIKHADFYVEHVGNFLELASKNYEQQVEHQNLLSSRKHAVNVLFRSIFKRNLFKIN